MNETSSILSYKGVVSNVAGSVLVKDIDEAEGRISGYFAVFGNVDSDGDMIMPGAFKRTIQNNGKRIKHLWQHDPLFPLAKPEISEDNYGLLFNSTISKTSYGRDAIRLYLDGVVDEHSIGYNVVKQNKASNYNELLELKLWEGSTVTWGANKDALVTGVKSMDKPTLFSKMDHVLKALRNGKYENEEVFDTLEIYFKQLQQQILDLNTQPAAAPALDPPKSKGINTDAVLSFIKIQEQLIN